MCPQRRHGMIYATNSRTEKDASVAAYRTQVLILGEPGRMQESLRTLLRAVPDLEVLGPEKGFLSLPDPGLERPDLVLLDFGRPAAELTREVVWIKTNWPQTRCLVLADTSRLLQAAKAAGADGVLLRGFAGGEFFTMLRELLQEKIRLDVELAQPSSPAKGNGSENSVSLVEARALLVSPAVF